jgi:TM2 domain-containing membrane protein YozV
MEKSSKSRTVAFLLCAFLGGVGAHQFYVGRFGKGVLYMLTLGFLGIGCLYDLISIVLGRFRDSDGKLLA